MPKTQPARKQPRKRNPAKRSIHDSFTEAAVELYGDDVTEPTLERFAALLRDTANSVEIGTDTPRRKMLLGKVDLWAITLLPNHRKVEHNDNSIPSTFNSEYLHRNDRDDAIDSARRVAIEVLLGRIDRSKWDKAEAAAAFRRLAERIQPQLERIEDTRWGQMTLAERREYAALRAAQRSTLRDAVASSKRAERRHRNGSALESLGVEVARLRGVVGMAIDRNEPARRKALLRDAHDELAESAIRKGFSPPEWDATVEKSRNLWTLWATWIQGQGALEASSNNGDNETRTEQHKAKKRIRPVPKRAPEEPTRAVSASHAADNGWFPHITRGGNGAYRTIEKAIESGGIAARPVGQKWIFCLNEVDPAALKDADPMQHAE